MSDSNQYPVVRVTAMSVLDGRLGENMFVLLNVTYEPMGCLCIYVLVCLFVCVFVCVSVCACASLTSYACLYVSLCRFIHVCLCVSMCLCVSVSLWVVYMSV